MALKDVAVEHDNSLAPGDTLQTRMLRCRFRVGHSLLLRAGWWGIVIKATDTAIGLRVSDAIFDIDGTSLRGLEADECEDLFADLFRDGCIVSAEPYKEIFEALPNQSNLIGSSSGWISSTFPTPGGSTRRSMSAEGKLF